MNRYYWKCRNNETKEILEVVVYANSYEKSEELISKDKNYTPLEYTGWDRATDHIIFDKAEESKDGK